MGAPASDIRVRVAAVIPHGDGIVFVRQSKGHASYYLLPGGGVEPGETLGDALVREVREETGLVVLVGRPLFISDALAPDGTRHMIQIVFLTTHVSGSMTKPSADDSILDVIAMPPSDVRPEELRPPMAVELAAAFEAGWTGEARYLGPIWAEGT